MKVLISSRQGDGRLLENISVAPSSSLPTTQWLFLDRLGLSFFDTFYKSVFLTLFPYLLFAINIFTLHTTAFPKNIPYKAYACQEAKAESPFASLGSSANR